MALGLWILVIAIIAMCMEGFWATVAFILGMCVAIYFTTLIEAFVPKKSKNSWFLIPLLSILNVIVCFTPYGIVLLGWSGFLDCFFGIKI